MAGISIYMNKYGIWWDDMPDWEIGEPIDFGVEILRIDDNAEYTYHDIKMSALYDDMTGYVDELQDEEIELKDNMLYIVCYYEYDAPGNLLYKVDFGIDKQQIIDNVKTQKYVEGATYYPMELMVKF